MKNLTAKHKKVKYCNKNKLLPSVERLILFVGVDTKALKSMSSFSHPHFSHLTKMTGCVDKFKITT